MLRMYSLYDRKMRQFSPPQLAQNDEVMARSLKDNIPDGSLPKVHPEDFDLFCIGEMDLDSGAVSGIAVQSICNLQVLIPVKDSSQLELV